ncbi:hypothetical protein PFISCL1PPCAC_20085, partial [Pristionchus fissidentatus]
DFSNVLSNMMSGMINRSISNLPSIDNSNDLPLVKSSSSTSALPSTGVNYSHSLDNLISNIFTAMDKSNIDPSDDSTTPMGTDPSERTTMVATEMATEGEMTATSRGNTSAAPSIPSTTSSIPPTISRIPSTTSTINSTTTSSGSSSNSTSTLPVHSSITSTVSPSWTTSSPPSSRLLISSTPSFSSFPSNHSITPLSNSSLPPSFSSSSPSSISSSTRSSNPSGDLRDVLKNHGFNIPDIKNLTTLVESIDRMNAHLANRSISVGNNRTLSVEAVSAISWGDIKNQLFMSPTVNRNDVDYAEYDNEEMEDEDEKEEDIMNGASPSLNGTNGMGNSTNNGTGESGWGHNGT